MAYITHPSTQLDTKPAPFMAAFSSKGPNIITPEILKVIYTYPPFGLYYYMSMSSIISLIIVFLDYVQPDITAPGVSIIAAYTESQGPTNQDFDKRRVQYNCVSGTSMSCPHVSGIVGLLKTLHPDWSPAAIRSSIMTTGKKFIII